jgi:hypothetical protein
MVHLVRPSLCSTLTKRLTSLQSFTALRVAQVRVLFTLPPQLRTFPYPLAYIEWFTPLRDPEPVIGMYKISRSTRNRHRNAVVVSVGDSMEDCHLSVFCQGKIDRTWTTDNSLEMGTSFFLNRYIDINRFSTS